MVANSNALELLSVVVPCYNEEEVLGELYSRLAQICRACHGDRYEIVLVDDGSADRTRDHIRTLCAQHSEVVGVFLARNHGHQHALTAGLHAARGDRILIIDADLQDPPELLPDMLRLMDDGADVVYGQRIAREGETAFKRITAGAFYRLLGRMTEIELPADTGDFRLMSRRALNVLLAMPEQHRFIRGMVSWIGFKQVPLPYVRHQRFAGTTKYPLRKMLRFAFDAITGFSIVPLRIASYLGLVVSALVVPLLFYTAYSWMSGGTMPGWTSVMLVLLMLGGAQLLVLGILGEYLGRLFMETKKRPLFIIEEVVTSAPGASRLARPQEVDNARFDDTGEAALDDALNMVSAR